MLDRLRRTLVRLVVHAVADRQFALAGGVGAAMVVAMLVIAWGWDLPVRDPDNLIPGYIRFPGIVLLAILLDILPRVAWRSRGAVRGFVGRLAPSWREVVRERWPASHWRFALVGAITWYVCYAAFRNVKSMAPFVNDHLYDDAMARLDAALFLDHDPAVVLHSWFGTDLAAHFFSAVYIVWIALVPVSIAVALVWTRHRRAGSWYVTAVAVDWFLGAATYLAFPSVGPVYSDPRTFADLPETYVSRLQESMWADRVAVLADPWAADTLQTIAAFASLHVGIMVTICLVAERVGLPRWVRATAWTFLVLTVFATVYLGWHFAIDVVAGAALGWFAVWVAGIATGNRVGLKAQLVPEAAPAASTDPVPAGAPGGRRATLATRSGPPRGPHAED